MHFADLNGEVLRLIIALLPQQDKFHLCLCSYQFYQPCVLELYRNIIILYDPIAHPKPQCRKPDYLDAGYTVLCGFSNISIAFEKHIKLLLARLQALCTAIEINPALGTYVNRLLVLNGPNDLLNERFAANMKVRHLLRRLLGKFRSMQQIFIQNLTLFGDLKTLIDAISCKSVVLDKFLELITAPELIVPPLVPHLPSNLNNVTSLILPLEHDEYWRTACLMLHFPPNLSHLRLVIGSSLSKTMPLFKTINFNKLKSFELICDADGFNMIPTCVSLRKLTVVQATTHTTHAANEEFDLAFLCMLDQLGGNLHYCSLSHKCPDSGNFEDGFEGNYLRRVEIFCDQIPRIFNKKQIDAEKKTLVMPNIFESLACYEQPMNTMLWNGCKCDTCGPNLNMIDEFLHLHKAYPTTTINSRAIRDLNTSTLFCNIGRVASHRWVPSQSISGNLPLLPFFKRYWDRHTCNTKVPFYCFDQQFNGEYQDGDGDGDQVDEFFDANMHLTPCNVAHWDYYTIMAHHLNSLVERIVRLARENAEEAVIGIDMHDGSGYNTIDWLIFNGISYTLDRESNGINYYCNVYESAEC